MGQSSNHFSNSYKKIAFVLICCCLLIGLGSCRLYLRMAFGVRNPDIEDHKSLVKKTAKFGLDTTNIVTVNASDFLKTMHHAGGIPEAAFFDSEGNYIEYRATDSSCNAGIFGFIPALDPSATYNKTSKTTMNAEWAKFRNLDGKALNDWKEPGTDFYILIYYTVWTGKLNEDHVKVWEDMAKKNTRAHLKLIKVNLDFQQYWDKKERDAIIKKLKKKKKTT
jgi:hypothetical protein